MAVIETWFEQDLQKPVKVRYIDGNLFSHNGNGNRIGVTVTNNGEAVTLTGTVSGYAVLADGTTVPCTGTRSGNKASILVPAAAYSPGSILISIFLTDGTTVTTLAALSSSVIMARTGNQIDPGSVVTDWTNTINAAMQSVETAAANLGNIVATPYANLTFPVPLGKYTIYNNGLYRCISPIASSEAWTAAHWTNVKLGDDVADLKSAFNDDLYTATGNKRIATTGINQYINLSGTTANVNSPSVSDSFHYSVVECVEGDKFTVSAYGGNASRAWGFVKADGTILSVAPAGTQIANKVLTAPANSKYFVINSRNDYSGISYYGDLLKNVVSVLEAKQQDILELLEPQNVISGYFVNSSGELVQNGSFAYADIVVNAGDKVKVINAYSNTADVVLMLSLWHDGVFATSIYAYPTANVPTDYEYEALTSGTVRVCWYKPSGTPFVIHTEGNDSSILAETFYDLSMFTSIGACGDSYTAAQFYKSGSVLIGDIPAYSWGKIIERMKGVPVTLYASSGADTHTWQERSSCLSALLNDTAKDLYIFNLCINDYTYVTKGTPADMEHAGTTEDPFPNTYYGNWASIITQVKAHASNARIVLMKCWLPNTAYYDYGSEPIENVCEKYSIPYIDPAEHPFFTSEYFSPRYGGHPTVTIQSGMAKAVCYLMEKCMQDNKLYFNSMINN